MSALSRSGVLSRLIWKRAFTSTGTRLNLPLITCIRGLTRPRLERRGKVATTVAPRRHIVTTMTAAYVMQPMFYVSILLGAWTLKCGLMVIFQDRLFYLSWLPPAAWRDTVDDVATQCRPVEWETTRIQAADGVHLAVCVGRMPQGLSSAKHVSSPQAIDQGMATSKVRTVICYFPGNGGSMPERLPGVSRVLQALNEQSPPTHEYVVAAQAYRGYWQSEGRPSKAALEKDAQHFIDWAFANFAAPDVKLQIVLWGHSLGSAVANTAAAGYVTRSGPSGVTPTLSAVVLETPSTSTQDLLTALTPQWWLPYRYMWRYLWWNNWQTAKALEVMADHRDVTQHALPPILLLCAEKDDIISDGAPTRLREIAERLRMRVKKVVVSGANHGTASIIGRSALVDFILDATP
ncbi:hypothetical protein BAUCODRAFT_61174 [Baudoinia panamericana UAMH 10762]|uniref:AB hydrolase-1 domain-containing protein n=1 Tax=Baudoinia panamericana (strain UAMH 10762) TaxID=717646 RepID=M2N8G2_BAUPA|nr:uncharacterized protein BAUCODRAFT_61174 [Baudoinia panamericana UAMH 10762]EMD00434.1 hypothetical protein BAUCODRAFT_61174 [Baudoinia panamericana UAMH 10762]